MCKEEDEIVGASCPFCPRLKVPAWLSRLVLLWFLVAFILPALACALIVGIALFSAVATWLS